MLKRLTLCQSIQLKQFSLDNSFILALEEEMKSNADHDKALLTIALNEIEQKTLSVQIEEIKQKFGALSFRRLSAAIKLFKAAPQVEALLIACLPGALEDEFKAAADALVDINQYELAYKFYKKEEKKKGTEEGKINKIAVADRLLEEYLKNPNSDELTRITSITTKACFRAAAEKSRQPHEIIYFANKLKSAGLVDIARILSSKAPKD